ncbi:MULTISPECIES: glutaredoxin family protein [Solibacillus]|uniref:Glutaredoxin family protein n=1 Tax=Solibacillus merdavium TaxID=2762218 RepID=A0ABR8XRN2_9BACL|nr:glutaredoxin family protein [Solibacillus merdavium]MBD8034571.1 glutaredoxin family protein [Solibacillus merdavium]
MTQVIVWSKDGCSYCEEVKTYLQQNQIDYRVVDVTNNDSYRDILDIKYGIRYVPVVEIGQDNSYVGVTELGIEHLEKALKAYEEVKA